MITSVKDAQTPSAKFLFEVSYEVANKIGGIYAVLKSKIPEMARYYGENYYLIGYYDTEKSKYEFIESNPGELAAAFKNLEPQGIKCRFGRWHTDCMPKCILVDVAGMRGKTNDIKTKLWLDYKIDSIRADMWFNDPVVWSYACGMLIEQLVKTCKMRGAVAQFHEWLSGAALLYLKKNKVSVASVFTTHATMLGRTLASYDEKFQEEVIEGVRQHKKIDPKKAHEHNIEAKHLTEEACAKHADVLTTVSVATATEVEYILGKKPDVVLPNGLETDRFPSMEELSYLHTKYKAKILNFLRGYFGAYYDLYVDDPRILYLSGRYEFRNKGIDVFIKSLGKLNSELKSKGTKRDIFAFIFVPSDAGVENIDVLQNVSLYRSIQDYLDEIFPDVRERMMANLSEITAGNSQARILSDGERDDLKKLYTDFRSKHGGAAPLSAFNMNYDTTKDVVLTALKDAGLMNRAEDRVKIIFYPKYLSNSDRLLNMSYKEMSIGCSAGIFPSFYEPWGYTPLEAAAYGSITVTTDYAGFGQFIQEAPAYSDDCGIFVLKRQGRRDDEVVHDLSAILRKIIFADKNAIIRCKHNAKMLAALADWKMLAKNYIYAHNMALDRASK